MANVTAALVKELRERTAAGMMDCKKALEEAAGDIELAIENMRKSGQAKAAKKAGIDAPIDSRLEGDREAFLEELRAQRAAASASAADELAELFKGKE